MSAATGKLWTKQQRDEKQVERLKRLGFAPKLDAKGNVLGFWSRSGAFYTAVRA